MHTNLTHCSSTERIREEKREEKEREIEKACGKERRVGGMKGENGIAQTENEFESVRKSRTTGDRFCGIFSPFPVSDDTSGCTNTLCR